MYTATILPQNLTSQTINSRFHMALAHLLDQPGYEEYSAFFKKVGKIPGRFVMMDTGLIEGDARPVEELVDKAKRYNVDEMVLNDVFMKKEETLVTSAAALEYVKKHHPSVRTMAVPQGNGVLEWIECAKEMLTWDVDTIGIPKVLTNLDGPHARLWALEEIQAFIGNKDIHLLGCWETPLELTVIENYTAQNKIKPVRSVDSVIAYAYAKEGLRISDDNRPQGVINFRKGECDPYLLRENITTWVDAAMSLEQKRQRDAGVYRIW